MMRTVTVMVAGMVAMIAGCVSPGNKGNSDSAKGGTSPLLEKLGKKAPGRETAFPGQVAVVYSPEYDISLMGLEKKYVFDVHKYSAIRNELIREGLRRPGDFLVPQPLTDEQLLLVHTPAYVEAMNDPRKAAEYLEFASVGMMPGPVYRGTVLGSFLTASGGTVLTAREALLGGVAVNLGGGYHHASSDEGGGFCLVADVPIAVRVLRGEGKVKRVLIIDTDVHHGQGNAKVLAGDATVRIVDFYERDIYPAQKEKVWRNVPFEPGITDEGYMALLTKNVPGALDEFKPELVMFLMGTDIYQGDRLSHTRITKAGILARDLYVVEQCRKRNVPVAMTLSGGYSPESWLIHADSIAEIIRKYDHSSTGSASAVR